MLNPTQFLSERFLCWHRSLDQKLMRDCILLSWFLIERKYLVSYLSLLKWILLDTIFSNSKYNERIKTQQSPFAAWKVGRISCCNLTSICRRRIARKSSQCRPICIFLTAANLSCWDSHRPYSPKYYWLRWRTWRSTAERRPVNEMTMVNLMLMTAAFISKYSVNFQIFHNHTIYNHLAVTYVGRALAPPTLRLTRPWMQTYIRSRIVCKILRITGQIFAVEKTAALFIAFVWVTSGYRMVQSYKAYIMNVADGQTHFTIAKARSTTFGGENILHRVPKNVPLYHLL